MKYMTKEWYETMQKTSLDCMLTISQQAEVFSEEYFKKLYRRKERKWLKELEEIAEINLAEVLPEELCFIPADGSATDEAELEEAKSVYDEFREKARESFENRHPFDPEQERKNFKKWFRFKVKELQEKLPEAILEKVADIRVLALDCASAEVKKEIRRFCRGNHKSVQSAMAGYRKQYERQFKGNPPAFAEKISLHDCIIKSCRKSGKDLIITLDNSGGFTNINQLCLKNCEVLKQEAPLRGAWCLYEELYKTGDKFEIHFLMEKKKLIDFIVSVDDVV